MKNLPAVYLPKWPGLLVAGNPVTSDQAIEILFRTADLDHMYTNDRAWAKLAHEIMGFQTVNYDDRNYTKAWDHNKNRAEELGCIPLEYLENDRIASAWIGGMKGWCNWNGEIRAAEFNIGKYPSLEEVFNEWQAIAQAFPFLNLRAQLLDREIGEEADEPTRPAVEFLVQDGEVSVSIPDDFLMVPEPLSEARMIDRLSRGGRRSAEHISVEELENRFARFLEIRGA